LCEFGYVEGKNTFDLPIQQLTKFELVMDLKAAKALGVTVARFNLDAGERLRGWAERTRTCRCHFHGAYCS
jgi:hypothetical protein